MHFESKMFVLRRPAFKRGHSKQGHHGHEDIVKVEVTVVPHPPVDGRLVNISILIQNERASVEKTINDKEGENQYVAGRLNSCKQMTDI